MTENKLIDEFCEEFEKDGRRMKNMTTQNVGLFADLHWDVGEIGISSLLADPGFVVQTNDRMVGIQRIGGQIRYYLGPAPTGESATHDNTEIGVVSTVVDCVELTIQFLMGRALRDLDVSREIMF